ncbi:MAG: hypothetical protein EXR85_02345 [Xanthomonadales bacterium]|nr:hypothetical protein [Xanthomonadales bacterium]
MKRTWIYVGGREIEVTQKTPAVTPAVTPQVMSDIQPYKSMADGSMITSRSQHREHLRRHNCFEVGNEKMETRLAAPVDTRKEILREQLSNMTHKDANKILSRLREEVRFRNPHREK